MQLRVLVTGSRDWGDSLFIRRELAHVLSEWPRSADLPVLIHGANGLRLNGTYTDTPSVQADAIADRCWRAWELPVERFFADWKMHPRAAGMIRNSRMVHEANPSLCLAFIRNGSPGASHCARLAERHGIPTRRFELPAVAS